jgi:hypothetical protein
MSEAFPVYFAMRSGGGSLVAKKGWSTEDRMLPCGASAKRNMPVVSHGEISNFVVAVFACFVKAPNKALEPTPRLGVVRSIFRQAKHRRNSCGVAHL